MRIQSVNIFFFFFYLDKINKSCLEPGGIAQGGIDRRSDLPKTQGWGHYQCLSLIILIMTAWKNTQKTPHTTPSRTCWWIFDLQGSVHPILSVLERHRNRQRNYSYPYGRITSRVTVGIVYCGLDMNSCSNSLTGILDFDPKMKENILTPNCSKRAILCVFQ